MGAWQKQIDAVVAGTVDATMVEEDVWKKLPKNALDTKIIARMDHLPTPLILGGKQLDRELVKELEALMFSYKPTPIPPYLFNGFVPFQRDLVANFFARAAKAFEKK